ncbi:unnamed protein product [Sympodiomycopsis kandeliae]
MRLSTLQKGIGCSPLRSALAIPASSRPCTPAKCWTRSFPRLTFQRPSSTLRNDSTTSAKPSPYYCTTPIFYVNADPHIGHLHSMVLADVLARWNTIRYNGWSPLGPPGSTSTRPLLATGTDEHGLKIQKAAETSHTTPKELCDRVSLRFRDLADVAGMQNTDFIRTTEERHKIAVHEIWNRLEKNGYIYKGSHEGWYSVSDEAFYPEGQVHDVKDAKTGEMVKVSIETGQRVEWTSEENYKFKMTAFKDQLIQWLENDPLAILPRSRHEQILEEVRTNLEDLSISRPSSRLDWGIRVPNDDSQSIYVWIDALVNYLTVTGFPWKQSDPPPGSAEWQSTAWPADAHVIGKDILRFHSIYWPSILLACQLPLPKSIITHSHWTKNKQKISKSTGNIIDPFSELAIVGQDVVRYYLCRLGGNLDKDSDYSVSLLKESHDKWLAGQLGNLVGRISSPKISKRLLSIIEHQQDQSDNSENSISLTEDDQTFTINRPESSEQTKEIEDTISNLPHQYSALIARAELSKALELVFELMMKINQFYSQTKPWSVKDSTNKQVIQVLYYSLEALRIVEVLLRPILPGKMKELTQILGIEHNDADWDKVVQFRESVTIKNTKEKAKILFPRLEIRDN